MSGIGCVYAYERIESTLKKGGKDKKMKRQNQIVVEVGENVNLEGVVNVSAKSIAEKIQEYLGILVQGLRRTRIYTIDGLLEGEIEKVVKAIFQKPTKKVSVNKPLIRDFDYAIWWGLKPGVKDNEGEVASDAIKDLIGRKIRNVYVSDLLYIQGELKRDELEKIVGLIANPNIERWKIISRKQWDPKKGIGPRTSEVRIEKEPGFIYIDIDIPDRELLKLNGRHNWALSLEDISYIKEYFYRGADFQTKRQELGMESNPTNIEIECLAQVLSDHCAHRTFHGRFHCKNFGTINELNIDDPFDVFIQSPTQEIAKDNSWIVSVLEDNAGAMFLDKKGEYVFCMKSETHNSPSNKEPYGGSYTGIAGIFRDIFGFGRGAKVIMGLYGFVSGPRDYLGDLMPEISPRQFLDGVISGVRDGGNKHGIPTVFGNVFFDESYIGKSLVYVTTAGISPRIVAGKPIEEKTAIPGDLIVIYGGRTGIDGIHGVTEASMGFSDKITMGHVQKGDSYLQRKVSEFLEEAAEKGLLNLSWDLGGGGMSSAISETARFAGGAEVFLEEVLLKYQGLDLWQIWVSESQERMLAAVSKDKIEEFLELAKLHNVEAAVVGKYTDSGDVRIFYNNRICACLPLELLFQKPPQWRFEAEWILPEMRLFEPVISEPEDHIALLKEVLRQPNICSKEWITRQYDHEVKAGSVIKPMIGEKGDVQGSAVVVRPVLGRKEGIVITQTLNPVQSRIDTFWMTLNIFDDAIRKITAVGGIRFQVQKGFLEEVPGRVGMMDNFCWPDIRYSKTNPDGKYKAAQLIRSLQALKYLQEKFRIPLLSGKDSMHIDGWVKGRHGEKHRVSGSPCLQITVAASIDNVEKCQTPDFKFAEDLIYIIGKTRNELGGSEFYGIFGYIGLNIPRAELGELRNNVIAVSEAIEEEILSASSAPARGGLIVDIVKMAIGGDLGAEIDLRKILSENVGFDFQLLYSETASRFLITIAPENKERIEEILESNNCEYAMIGKVIAEKVMRVTGLAGTRIISEDIEKLREAYKGRFGDLI